MRRLTRLGGSLPIAEAELADGVGRGCVSAMPPRPSLPPLLGCALSQWASCAAVFSAAASWDVRICIGGGAIAALATAVAIAALWRHRAVQAWAALAGALLGVACALGCAAVQHTESRNLEDAPSRVRFEALADGSRSMYGSSVLARTELPSGVHAIVLVRISEDDIVRYGEVFEADASLAVPSGSSAAYCWRQGAVATARASDISLVERHDLLGTLVGLRNRVIDALADLDAGDGSAVLAALVCGWRIPLEEGEVYEAFKVTGLAHLVAVSGAHLSIVSAFIAGALRLMRVPRVPAMAVQAMLLLSYLVLAAAPPSAVRAAVMAFAGMLSFAVRRRPASLGALSACMLGFVALEPTAALSVSFALSALSTLGIVVFSGLCSSWIADLVPVLPRIVREALALTAASSITAAPFSASLFSMLPLVAPLANVVAAAPVSTCLRRWSGRCDGIAHSTRGVGSVVGGRVDRCRRPDGNRALSCESSPCKRARRASASVRARGYRRARRSPLDGLAAPASCRCWGCVRHDALHRRVRHSARPAHGRRRDYHARCRPGRCIRCAQQWSARARRHR